MGFNTESVFSTIIKKLCEFILKERRFLNSVLIEMRVFRVKNGRW